MSVDLAVKKVLGSSGGDLFHYLLAGTPPMAVKVTVDGTTTYIAKAPAGSSQSAPVWQAKKIAVSGSDTIITFADGNSNFDNVATTLSALSYS